MNQIVTVSLRLENDAVPESWLVTAELESVLGFAAAANRVSPQPEVFDLTFTTMLYGFLRAADACSSFFQSYGAAQGFNRVALLARKGLSEQALTSLSPMNGVQGVFVYTVSGKRLLENARG